MQNIHYVLVLECPFLQERKGHDDNETNNIEYAAYIVTSLDLFLVVA